MNSYRFLGVMIGLAVGLILVVLFFKYVNNNHRVQSEYDERQQIVRSRGYKAAFFAMVIYEAIMIILSIGGIELPFSDCVIHFIGIMVGCLVLSGYAIWNGAYWGLNNNRKRFIIILTVTMIINLIPAIGAIVTGEIAENGKLGPLFINVLIVVMMIIVGAELLVTEYIDRKVSEKDNE